jgi:steroid delta-isomerase-like uncharacterized protein
MAETSTAPEATADAPAEAKPDAKPQRKRISRRKAVEQKLRAYFDDIARRDSAAAAAHWSENGVDDIGPVGVLRGPAEIRAFFDSLFAAVPDLTTTVTRLVPGERDGAVEWRMEGTFTGAPYMGIEPTGKRVEIAGVDLFELEDDKLASCAGYFDGASFARQIGMLPADGSGADRAMKGAFNAVTKVRRAVAERRGV